MIHRSIGHWLAALALAALQPGCAGLQQDTRTVVIDPRGPGAVFPSIEAAAIDALAWAHLKAHESRTTRLMRAGTIFPSGAGFSYGRLVVGDPAHPRWIEYDLRPADVAHFRALPRTTETRLEAHLQSISRHDRGNVDDVDPAHRPFFLLTPRLRIHVYRGEGRPGGEIARLDRRAEQLLLARTTP